MSDQHLQEWESYVGESPWQSTAPSTEMSETEFFNGPFEITSPGESPFQLGGSHENAHEMLATAESGEFESLSAPESLVPEPPQALQGLPAGLALHQLVNSPEIQQVSLASLLGKGARQTVRVDGADMSVPSYLRLISRLSGEVAAQSESETPDSPGDTCITPVAVIAGYSEYSKQLNAAQQATAAARDGSPTFSRHPQATSSRSRESSTSHESRRTAKITL